MLNRSVLILRPAQPFLEWAASIDDSGLVPDPKGEQTVYLLPNWYDGDQGMALVEMAYEDLFERELAGWHTDEEAWPRNRTFAMFLEWFTIEQHSIVEDLCDFEIEDDEPIEEDDNVDLSDPEQLAEVLAMFERISAGGSEAQPEPRKTAAKRAPAKPAKASKKPTKATKASKKPAKATKAAKASKKPAKATKATKSSKKPTKTTKAKRSRR